jgi:DNA-binding transcriptional LysR family regulator
VLWIRRSFHQSSAEIDLVFEEMLADQQMAKIVEGSLDVGFIRLPVRHAPTELDTKVLMTERMVFALRNDHPLARQKEIPVAALEREAFVVWASEEPTPLQDHLSALAQQGGFPLRVTQSAPSFAGMIALVAGGSGVAYVPESLRFMSVPSVCCRRSECAPALREFLRRSDELTRAPLK